MQVEVAETGPCSRTLTIRVPPERIRQHVDELYASANRQVKLKGFRPGHVPRKVIEKMYGADILKEAKEQIVNRCFNDACHDRSLVPVGRAAIDGFDQLELTLDQPLEFKVKIDVKPEFELQNFKGIEVAAFDPAATDAEIDNALQEIAGQKRSIRPVTEPAKDGDFVKVDLRFREEGGALVHERKGVQLNTRIPVAGTDPEQFAKVLTGATAGQELEIQLTFPENFEKDAFRGKPGKAQLQVHEVLRVSSPPIDDALAKTLDFADLAALRDDLRRRIGEEKLRVGKLRQEDQVLDTLINEHQFELPDTLVQEQARISLAQFGKRLEESGMPKDEIEKKLEESRPEAQSDAQRRVRMFFLIDAIARREKMFVTENDIQAEIRNIAQQNQVTPAQVGEYLEKNNQLGELRLALLERKVRDFLREHAKIVDRKAG
jgi:trigger factor